MVLFWCRTRQAQLRSLSNQFKRCYFQKHTPSSVIHEGKIGVVNGQSLTFHKIGPELGNFVRFFAAPVQAKPKYDEKAKGPRMNDQISAQFVRLVTDEGHSVVSRHEALDRARRLGVDLVEVQADANPPVCKLMNYNKEMYLKQVKEKEQSKKKSDLVLRGGALKEVRITYKIDKHDLKTKADMVRRLAESGHRVKCMAVEPKKKGSEKPSTEKQDFGKLLSQLTVLLEDFSLVESGPIVDAKQAYVVVRHVKYGPLKKGPGKKKLLEMSNDDSSTDSPEKDESDPELDTGRDDTVESDSPDDVDQERMVKFAPETSNRYATRQTNASVPGSENRYATKGPSSVPGAKRFGPESQSQKPGGNRQFDSNRRGPGQAASSYGIFGAPKPKDDFQREKGPTQVNRYQKGPNSQRPSSDFSRENSNINPNGVRERQAGSRR
ncbi:translation initiation factor IF3-1, mitochondrial [Rutidosis leptorrhynchoides]|uniref:translation initiation factor IF3-1, mitochondrial n=1 Tax=Rutidosis leptorrhynchoides TaxID=125765 RepID=UPI003A99BC16